MWRLGPFGSGCRYVARLQLTTTPSAYDTQIGAHCVFYAYCNAIHLDLIDREDLPAYDSPGARHYHYCRVLFQVPLVPNIYEWLLISPDRCSVHWDTTPLTYNLSPQIVPNEYRETTHWYLIDNSAAPTWQVRGQMDIEAPVKMHSDGIAVIKIQP
jgi:hypothetical protein